MKAIVLAGGRGVRLHPLTKVIPKPLVPLGDVPILEIILLQLRDAGFTDITLSLCHKARQISSYFGSGRQLDIDLKYSHSNKLLGTAGPLRLIESFDAPCLVANADLLSTIDYGQVFRAHQRSGALASVVLCRHTHEVGFGVVDLDDREQITNLTEKPSVSFLVSSGVYMLDPAVLQFMRSGEYLDMPVLLQDLIDRKLQVRGQIFEGEWYDIGTLEKYQSADEAFRLRREHFLKSAPLLADELVAEIDPAIEQTALEEPLQALERGSLAA